MKFSIISLISVAALGVEANTIVEWGGCQGEKQRTSAPGGDCTNISGWKNSDLCSVWVPPPGTDRCEFYTTGCGNPFGTTYYCSVASGKCNAQPWKAIESYRCWSQ